MSRRKGDLLQVLFVLFALLTSGSAVLADDPGSGGLTLSSAVETALRSNPLIQASQADRDLAAAGLREARSGWFPVIQLQGSYTRSNNPVFAFGSRLEQARFSTSDFALDNLNHPDPYDNFRAGATARIPLFDQLQTGSRVARARIGEDQASRRAASIRQQIRFEVIRSYFGALVAEAKRSVTDEAVKTAEADVKRIGDLLDVGRVVRSDLLAAQVQLSEFQQERIQALGDVAVGHAALNTALGLPVVLTHRLAGALTDRRFEIPEQEVLLQKALERRPDYAAASAAVRSAEEAWRGAAGQYLPRIDAVASYGGSGKNPEIDSTDYTLGVAFTLDLIELGRSARVDQARAGVALAAADRQQAANRIALEVVKAYQQCRAAEQRLAVAAGMAGHATEVLRIVQDRYQAGLTTITEVLRAETALLRARTAELGARYEYYVGFANILLATGTLDDARAFGP